MKKLIFIVLVAVAISLFYSCKRNEYIIDSPSITCDTVAMPISSSDEEKRFTERATYVYAKVLVIVDSLKKKNNELERLLGLEELITKTTQMNYDTLRKERNQIEEAYLQMLQEYNTLLKDHNTLLQDCNTLFQECNTLLQKQNAK